MNIPSYYFPFFVGSVNPGSINLGLESLLLGQVTFDINIYIYKVIF